MTPRPPESPEPLDIDLGPILDESLTVPPGEQQPQPGNCPDCLGAGWYAIPGPSNEPEQTQCADCYGSGSVSGAPREPTQEPDFQRAVEDVDALRCAVDCHTSEERSRINARASSVWSALSAAESLVSSLRHQVEELRANQGKLNDQIHELTKYSGD